MAQLRIPGPTPCPPEVLQASARQMINHRGAEFHKMLQDVTEKMKQVYQTKNDLYLLTGSGTGGLEAAVVNMLSPKEKALFVSIGVFGDRWASIAKTFGADVVKLDFEWGKPADPDAVKKAIAANPDVKAVFITHNETSTGVTNDMAALAKAVKGAGKLLVVDAISGMSSLDLPVDKLGLDVVISGSQKGWMVPPGMAMVSISADGWKAVAQAKMPRFYWDFTQAKKYYEKYENPWTPAVSIVYAFDAALNMILKEGLQNVFARHMKIGKMMRDGAKAMGLQLLVEKKYASNTVTAVKVPEAMGDGKKFREILRDEYKIVITGGQGKLDGKIFRIGHMGFVSEKEIKELLEAMRVTLPKVGFKVK
jgi:aspartate aminotransferase-like enzyme